MWERNFLAYCKVIIHLSTWHFLSITLFISTASKLTLNMSETNAALKKSNLIRQKYESKQNKNLFLMRICWVRKWEIRLLSLWWLRSNQPCFMIMTDKLMKFYKFFIHIMYTKQKICMTNKCLRHTYSKFCTYIKINITYFVSFPLSQSCD